MSPILVSTDIGSDIDDALALLIILNHPEILLSGIYTVNGAVEHRCYIAKQMVNLAYADVPVCCGIGKPVGSAVLPYTYFEEYLIDDCFIDEEATNNDPKRIHFQPLSSIGVIEDGIAHMAAQLHAARHCILSLGPMSNIAALMQRFPDVIKNIERLYIMGFRIEDGLEHNIRFDVAAAEMVLQSGIPITIVPGDICSRYKMPWNPKTSFPSPAGEYVTSMLRAYMGAKIIEESRWTKLTDLMEKSQMADGVVTRVGADKYQEITRFKHLLLVNFDEATPFLERDEFLPKLRQLIEYFEDDALAYQNGTFLARYLKRLLLRKVSVADAYLPFCFLHPEMYRTESMNVTCDLDGGSSISGPGKYEVVVDLNYAHFEAFLYTYLH